MAESRLSNLILPNYCEEIWKDIKDYERIVSGE